MEVKLCCWNDQQYLNVIGIYRRWFPGSTSK